jgi:hypothetical protein
MNLSDIFSGAVSPAKWRALGEYLESSGIVTGPGLRVRKVGNKSIITSRRRGLGGGSGSSLDPWQPIFFTTGTAPSLVYKCRFNLGTVNNVAASNWNDEHTLPTDDTIKFVVLTITTASGKVTGVSISVDSSPPTDDVISKDTPPVTHKIVLGAIGKQTAQMIVTTNLNLVAVEVFRETVAAPATGAEPFSRWWRWTSE